MVGPILRLEDALLMFKSTKSEAWRAFAPKVESLNSSDKTPSARKTDGHRPHNSRLRVRTGIRIVISSSNLLCQQPSLCVSTTSPRFVDQCRRVAHVAREVRGCSRRTHTQPTFPNARTMTTPFQRSLSRLENIAPRDSGLVICVAIGRCIVRL